MSFRVAREGWSISERDEIIAEYFLFYPSEDDDDPNVGLEDRMELQERYREGLPVVALARCPFTNELLYYPLDHFDLDGPYWDSENPIRPAAEVPPTFFALTGAVKIDADDLADAPFLCKPGPEAPFVVPRVLSNENVRAVLWSFPLGPHTAYPITYFAQPIPHELQRPNEWGTEEYWYADENGDYGWDSADDDEDDFDFDLAPWIESGKLLWIPPGDRDLTLHTDTSDCPYLGRPGHRSITRIEEGEAWWPEDILDEDGSG